MSAQVQSPVQDGAVAAPPRDPRLAAANQAFQSMLDTVPGTWFFARRDGSMAYVNAGACSSLGYSPAEFRRISIFDLDPTISPEDWERLWNGTKAGDSLAICSRHRRHDGSDFPVEVRATRVILDGEELSASYTIDLTVTEHTREALHQTEQRLQRLLSHIPDLIFTLALSPEPHFSYLSPSALALLGHAADALIGSPSALQHIVHADDLARLVELPEANADASLVIRFHRNDGQLVWFEVRAMRLRSDGAAPARIEGVARDVSRTYQAERANRRLAAALNCAAEAIVVTDAQGHVEFVNAAYENTTGTTLQGIQGTAWSALHLNNAEAIRAAAGAVLTDGVPWGGRFSAKRSNGEPRWEETHISPIRDPLGTVAGCVAITRDITEHVALERQLRHAQKMQAVGQLAGSVAHDFNNLLQIIQGNTALLARRRDSSETDRFLHDISMATERAAQLVRQLLAFSRKDSTEFAPVDLVKCVGAMLDMLKRLLGNHIDVIWQCSLQRAVVVGSASQVGQVVMNLCINARDAMPDGGTLTLTLRQAPSELIPPPLRDRGVVDCYEFCVEDTGYGIPEEYRERIFEPFFTLKAPGQGTGLGLATAYSIIESHHGAISFDSTIGRGTTFRIYLPSGDGDCERDVQPVETTCLVGNARLVLVAEDEDAVRRLTARHLTEAGFSVVLASDGEQAIQQIQRYGAQLAAAVLDAMMPNRTGFEVYQEIRRRGLETPVLFVTGYDYATLPKLDNEQLVAVLQKPFNESALVGRLVELIHARTR